jgi:nucleoside-diphosphate-sugar epimerase
MQQKRVLITGAGGFVGSALAKRLVRSGYEVHALLKGSTKRWRLADVQSDLRAHEVDVQDFEGLTQLCSEVKPEIVYHLAVHGAYPTQSDADAIINTNILGTWNLLKALSKIDYEAFVSAGSSSEYGFKDFAMRETDIPEPNSYYAVAKCAQTLLCQHVARAEKRPINTLRIFSAYGPYEEPRRLVPTLISRALNNQELLLVPPETARDFVYVEDVVDAFLCIEQLSKLQGEVINVGTGLQGTVRDVVEAILEHTGARVECKWGAMPGRIWDAKIWVADCTRAKTLLGWRAKTRLTEGLRNTVAWTKAERSKS